MPAYYDESTKTWYCKFYYTDYTGTKKQKKKRGFKLQREAKEWERTFIERLQGTPDMTFKTLCDLYLEDKLAHTKLITYETKKNRIDNWLLPAFESRAINDISPVNIRKWQADLKNCTGTNGKPLSAGYMQNLVTELSSIFNFAVRFYNLPSNPCRIAGNTVGHKKRSILFWTKEEFDQFISTFEHQDPYYTIFLILYYTGIRKGELQALTAADVDLDNHIINIDKTFKFINGSEVVTSPKTAKSVRQITIPPFLADCIREYESRIYGLTPTDRLFCYGKTTYSRQLDIHAQKADIKRIRVHDLRHSHASLLIELGFSAILVSERLGHDDVSTTLNIYSHLFPSKQSEVADRLQKLCQNNDY